MARRFHSSRGRAGTRRETAWIAIQALVDTATNALVLISQLNATALALRPFTIVRIHWSIWMITDNIASSENQLAAVGAAVVSEQASAIGITAVPTPISDAGSDLFFLHQSMVSATDVLTAVGQSSPSGVGFEVDSKAMRKVNDDQDVVFVYENSGGGGGSTIMTMGRMLLKLH